MTRLKRRAVCLVASVVMVGTGVIAVAPGIAVAAAASDGRTTCSNAYRDGDSRLGPKRLPTAGPIHAIVANYRPLAGLSPEKFIATFWNPAANGGTGGWNFPPDNGFLIGPNGQPEEMPLGLAAGQEIDRFGSVFGSFLAPVDTPYASRALPPMSLDNFNPAVTCNYILYDVLKPFEVEAGPIAPGFGQPGLGRQYQLVSSLVPGSPSPLNVLWLLNNGFLQSLNVPTGG